jgi:hypothetical protein
MVMIEDWLMKIIFLYFFFLAFLAACTGLNSESPVIKDSLTLANDSLPFKAVYSSDFIPGKQADVALVMKVFKAWEQNDMKTIKASFADSVELYFPTGDTFKNSMDSFIKIADTYYRDSLSKKEILFYTWSASHSVDRHEDWLNIRYKEIDQYKTGRTDSLELEDDNLIKEGKIIKVYSHMRKLNP